MTNYGVSIFDLWKNVTYVCIESPLHPVLFLLSLGFRLGLKNW